ncbi:MAG: hypothetical protein WAW68_08265, partial [Rhodoferax sp.]
MPTQLNVTRSAVGAGLFRTHRSFYFQFFNEVNMPLAFDDLPALARAAVPLTSACFSPELVLWEESLPGGCHWSGLLRR